ncbi:signal peptidase I [Roseibium sp. SCPC15]|uniref:signal peptidase I n=1 Tax=Roseibium sp. SCP15 TaxID=3141376 RepID=UPI003339FF4B
MKLFSIGVPFLLLLAASTLDTSHDYLDTYASRLKAYSVPSGSMKPTLMIADRFYAYGAVADPLAGLMGHFYPEQKRHLRIERGDVVVFKLPSDNSVDYVKRVVGLPGDTIQMLDGVLNINGEPTDRRRVDDYVEQGRSTGIRRIPRYRETLPNGVSYETLELTPSGQLDNTREYQVPEGHYFVLGDNRDNSIDSRVLSRIGFVPVANITGIATGIFYSGETGRLTWRTLKPEV